MATVTINIHGTRVEAREREGTIWLDVTDRDARLAIPRLTVFLDYANVLGLVRQLDEIATELAPLHEGEATTVAGTAELAIER